MAVDWAGVFETAKSEEPDDEGTLALLALCPADRREIGEPLIRAMLANVKAQVTEAEYKLYCANLKRAYDAHVAGDTDTARQIVEAYGIPYDLLAAQLE